MSEELQKPRILIIDDAITNIKVLGSTLRSDYKILFSLDAQEGLNSAMANQPNLILLDILMPGMDGYEACRRLKADERTKDIPVIFITSRTGEEDEAKGFEAGGVDYITKPFSPVITKARIKMHLELKKNRDLLAGLLVLDALTNISNRRRFDEYLTLAWGFAVRDSKPISLIMIDIDYFKKFNDNYGHQAGDSCLTKVASALASSLKRSTDLAARYGGEEFACILPNTDMEGAMETAESLRERIMSLNIPHAYSSAGNCVTISQGVASLMPSMDIPLSDILKIADVALYKAKENGRNRIFHGDQAA